MQTFQSKMADNQSQQPAKSAKNTDLHISASTGIYLFSLFGSKLPHNKDAQSPQQHGRGCLHAHDGLGGTVVPSFPPKHPYLNASQSPLGVCVCVSWSPMLCSHLGSAGTDSTHPRP